MCAVACIHAFMHAQLCHASGQPGFSGMNVLVICSALQWAPLPTATGTVSKDHAVDVLTIEPPRSRKQLKHRPDSDIATLIAHQQLQ